MKVFSFSIRNDPFRHSQRYFFGNCCLLSYFSLNNFSFNDVHTCLNQVHVCVHCVPYLGFSKLQNYEVFGLIDLCFRMAKFFISNMHFFYQNSFCNNHGVQLVEGQEYFKNLVEAQVLSSMFLHFIRYAVPCVESQNNWKCIPTPFHFSKSSIWRIPF